MNASPAKWTRFRITIVFCFFVLAWVCILWRAFQLQVLDRDHLAGKAARECQRVIKINPVRGDIFDRRGEKLAVSLEADSIFADPTEVEEKSVAAAKLAVSLGLDRRRIAKSLRSKTSFVWLKRQVSPGETARVASLKLKGIGSLKESKRFYPNKRLAAQVLGFTGVDAQGLEGLESMYEEHLRGGVNSWLVKQDALRRTFLDRGTSSPQGLRGASLTLTLDRRIQYVTEKALNRAVKKYGARGGLALVVRPRTGEILASAVAPGYNPNAFRRYSPSQRRNRILTDIFDPGSTFKIFLVAVALEEGVVRPMDLVFCENGAYTVDRRVINDHHEYGWLTVNKIIKYSSNIGAVKIGEMVGPARLYSYLARFGFGRRTEIDLTGESPGLMRPYKRWRNLDAANVAFGQGVSVTALQMVMAMSALANDGLLMRPYIVSKITDSFGQVVKKTQPEIIRRVISSQTAREIQLMLRLVVEEGGTGVRAETRGYPTAGKTGTAQKLDKATKRYSQHKFFSSFLGFVPYQNPELTIFVALDEPWPKIYGGVVAAPVFNEIAARVLPMLNVPPTPAPPDQTLIVEADESGAAELRTKYEPPVITTVAGTDGDTRSVPRALVRASPMPGTMPNLGGLSMRRVMDLMSCYNVELKFMGSGRAVWQSPAAGRPLDAGQVCRIKFEQG